MIHQGIDFFSSQYTRFETDVEVSSREATSRLETQSLELELELKMMKQR